MEQGSLLVAFKLKKYIMSFQKSSPGTVDENEKENKISLFLVMNQIELTDLASDFYNICFCTLSTTSDVLFSSFIM